MSPEEKAALWDLGMLSNNWANARLGTGTAMRNQPSGKNQLQILEALYEANPDNCIFWGTESLSPEKRVLAAAGYLVR
jgi:hypothetical protein